MFLCGGDIVTIILLVLSILAIVSKKKEPERHIASRPWTEDSFPGTEVPEADSEKNIERPKPFKKVQQIVDNPKEAVDEKKSSKLGIDKKKLIIYSEIMKPKFDE